jgi:GTPase
MFIDEAEVFVRSGRGGNGFVHFHREKFVPRGGPDGGDGGRGGDVVLFVAPGLNTLSAFRYQQKYIADDGKKGGVNNQTGRSAEDLMVPVPPGTLVYDCETNELLGDLVEPDQKLLVCKGGRGGKGNTHFATSRNQAPRMGEKGEPPQERTIKLELKLIADVGIVGVPNAGKSSLLAAVTNANPKIADYPFTTLEPNLGVADLDDKTSLILADIPGLIEGAHTGVGLGDSFLRHIQRTRVLIHVIDGLSENPLTDFSQINSEMALFDPNLETKPMLVAFNKMDLPDVVARWPKIEKELKKHGYEPMPISTASHLNLNELLWKAVELMKTTPVVPVEAKLPVYRPPEDAHDFTVEREEGGWRVKGKAIERAAAMTYWEFDGSVRHFQRLMETLGVDQALRKAGIQEGESVFIGENELEWQD